MTTILSLSAISAAAIVFFSHRLLGYLRHFQEYNYSSSAFIDWLWTNKIYDKKGSLIATTAAVGTEIVEESPVGAVVVCTIAMVAFIYLSLWEGDPRQVGYPRLLPTRRVIAIYGLALSLYSISFVVSIVTLYQTIANVDIAVCWLFVIVAIQSSPLWVFLANTIVRSLNPHI
jgi:UDP-N-acetylmuramoyl-tripeptide--D-alanyl-D-alanine ligase